MNVTAKLFLLSGILLSGVSLYSCNKNREADWLCKCPEGIPSTDPNIGTKGSSVDRYNAVTKSIASARCKEESKGRISDCELTEVK